MSSTETRVALYSCISGTEGFTRKEIIERVRTVLGEPTELELGSDGSVVFFTWNLPPLPPEPGQRERFHMRQDGVTCPVMGRDGRWWLRHTLRHTKDSDSLRWHIWPVDLETKTRALDKKLIELGLGDWCLAVQTWWNAGDEPFPEGLCPEGGASAP